MSDAFSEGQARDINGDFPSDSHPHTDYYDYLSDSDLEDEYSSSEEEYEEPSESDPELPRSPQDSDSQAPPTTECPPHPSPDLTEVQSDHRLVLKPFEPTDIQTDLHRRPDNGLLRMGKVAVIRDMAAVTCVKLLPIDFHT